MPVEIKKLKNARGILKGVLTHNYNALNDPEFTPTATPEELEITTELVRTTLQSFNDIQKQIEQETDDDKIEEEAKYRYDFEILYTSLYSKLRQLQKKTATPTETGTLLHHSMQRDCAPKINFAPLQTNETIKNFANRLKVYLLLNSITDPKIKVYTLLSTVSSELHQRIHDLCSPGDSIDMDFDELVQMLDEFVDPKPSIWASQHAFISRTQQVDETIATYATELKKLSLHCEFKCPDCKKPTIDSFLSLQLIRGLKDGDIRTKLLQEKDTLPFTTLVHTASVMESGKRENTEMANTTLTRTEPRPINKLSNNKGNSTTTRFRPPTSIKDLKGNY